MANGGALLAYELYKGASGKERWGDRGSQRRASTQADSAAGNHDGLTRQGFTYRGVIDPNQTTPPAGRYVDNVVVDVAF